MANRTTGTTKRANRRPRSRRVYMGEAAVDSGQLMVMDPCYVDGHWRKGSDDPTAGPFGDGTYAEACEASTNENWGGQLNFDNGISGLGVVFASGFGDGIYEVWGTLRELPGHGEMLVKVEVILVPDGSAG